MPKIDQNFQRRLILVLTVYNFHSLFFQERFFIFLTNFSNKLNFKIFKKTFLVSSLTELFYAGNWLEREVAELNGVNFFFNHRKHFTLLRCRECHFRAENAKRMTFYLFNFWCFVQGKCKINDFFWNKSSILIVPIGSTFGSGFHFFKRQKNVDFYGK